MFDQSTAAERVLEVLDKRLGKYGLELHPEKTIMVDFRYRPKLKDEGETVLPTSFNFLGFTHIWIKSRKGWPIVRQQTAKDRLARATKAINQECRRIRHWPFREQHQKLSRMLRGHFAYFGISGNSKRLASLKFEARRSLRKWLSRRSSKSLISWKAFNELLKRFPLPPARIMHRHTDA